MPRTALFRRVAIAVPLCLALVGCGGGDAVVASVNGSPITLAEVEELRPDGDGADGPFFHQDLQNLVFDRLLTDAIEGLGVSVEGIDVEAGVAEFRGLVASQTDPSTGAPVEWEDFLASQSTTEEIVALTVAQQLRSERAVEWFAERAEVTDADIDAALEDGLLAEQARRAEACVRHILVETEQAADVVLELVTSDGADFAALASRYSIGPSAPDGGDLGCAPASDYVDPFALAIVEAELGIPYGPVETEFGWHVLLVSERSGPTVDELRDELVDDIRGLVEADLRDERGRAAFEEWAAGLPGDADVEVEERYGSWIRTQSGSWVVAPPAG